MEKETNALHTLIPLVITTITTPPCHDLSPSITGGTWVKGLGPSYRKDSLT